MKEYDIIIIGGGPAGLGAAIKAKELGAKKVLIIERDQFLGGILKQCIHNGFGLHLFNEELTGPEYANRFIDLIEQNNIEYRLETMVLSLTKDRTLITSSQKNGLETFHTKAVILAMGCRERSRGALMIPGTNPSGIFTAGSVQRFMNLEGMLPGKKVVILGSGDIGLIMARRLTLEGIKVEMVCEIMDYPGGLTRNIVQCLHDYDIPLKLDHTVKCIHGKERLEGVTIVNVKTKEEQFVDCDTLLLSVGLIPENELSLQANVALDEKTNGPVVDHNYMTDVEGIFACGNVLHVHDLVDYVTQEGEKAAKGAVGYIEKGLEKNPKWLQTKTGKGIRYVLPHIIDAHTKGPVRVYFRSEKPFTRPVVSAGRKTRSFEKLMPSEMEYISIDPGAYEEEIVIEVKTHE